MGVLLALEVATTMAAAAAVLEPQEMQEILELQILVEVATERLQVFQVLQ